MFLPASNRRHLVRIPDPVRHNLDVVFIVLAIHNGCVSALRVLLCAILLLPLVPLIERLLPLPAIPLQRPAQTVDPVLAPPPRRHHIRERIPTRGDCDVIAGTQLDALAAVETDPAVGAGIVRNPNTQDHAVGEDDGAERESMGADCGDKDDRVLWVAERAAGREVVGCAACGRRDADPVCLDGGEVLLVAEELNRGHGGVGSTVDDDVVEDLEGAVGLVRAVVIAFFADELFDEVLLDAGVFVSFFLRAHDRAFEAEAERDGDALAEGFGEGVFVLVEVEFGEEAEGAEGEGEDWRNDALEEPACVEDRAVAAEGDDEVEGMRSPLG